MMRSMERTILVGAIFVLCGCGASEAQLRTRAAFDLNCGENQLELIEIDSRTEGVRGCGQQVTCVENCNGPKGGLGTECTWVLNTDSSRIR